MQTGTDAIRDELRNTRFFSVSKYLLPSNLLSSFLGTTEVPRQAKTLAELESQFPDLVATHRIAADDIPLPQPSFKPLVVREHRLQNLAVADFPALTTTVANIRNGHSIGRECLIVGPQRIQVEDIGYLAHARHRSRLWGWWNLKYQRRLRVRNLENRHWLPRPVHFPGRVAVLNKVAAHCYFHWQMEVAPKLTAIRMSGFEPDCYLVDIQKKYQRDMLEMMGVPIDRCIQPHCAMNLCADELIVATAAGPSVLHQHAIDSTASLPSRKPHRRIYVSRQFAQNRKVVNEQQVQQVLSAHQFETVHFERLTVCEQIQLMHETQVLVTAHGSGLANMAFAQPGMAVIEIFPRNRANIDLYPGYSHLLGHQHITVLGDVRGRRKNIEVPIDDLTHALQCVLRSPQSQAAQIDHSTEFSSA